MSARGGDPHYVQRLQGVDVALERATDRTPDRSSYHVFVADRLVGSFKRIKDAQVAFREEATKAGWQPAMIEKDPAEMLAREQQAKDRAAYEEYWGSATSFRRAGRPRRRQR